MRQRMDIEKEIDINDIKKINLETVNKKTYHDYSYRIQELSNKIDFMNKRMFSMINEVVNDKFEEIGFREFVTKSAKDIIKSETDEIIKKIIKETLNKLKNEIKITSKITQDLCLSIDDDIKKTIRSIDCSYSTDKIIKESIDKHIKKLTGCIKFNGDGVEYLELIKKDEAI